MPRVLVVQRRADVEESRIEHGVLTPAEAFQVFDAVRSEWITAHPSGLYRQGHEQEGAVTTDRFTSRSRPVVSVAVVMDYGA